MTEKLMQMEVDVSVSGPAGDGGGDSREEAARTPVRSGNPKPGSDEPSPASDDTPDSTRPRAESFTSDRGGSSNNNNKKKHRRGKHKGGRRHRHWKPYTKMTWDEKKELEERETRRAYQKREQRFASGQPMAPYNTTQFLMEQHPPSDVNLCDSSRPRLTKSEAGGGGDGSGGASGSADGSSDEYYSSPDDEEIFLEKEFTEAYENYHAERLQTMSKDELVREYLELESKVELMEKKTKEQCQTPNGRLSSSATTEEGGFPSPTPRQNGQEDKSSPTTTTTETPKDKVTGTTPPGSRRQPQEAATAKLSSLEEEIHKLRQENEKLRQENEQLRRTNVSNSVNEGEP